MSRLRLSILSLIAGVVASGVAFAALRSGSDYWLSAFYTMTSCPSCWEPWSPRDTAEGPAGRSGSASPSSAGADFS